MGTKFGKLRNAAFVLAAFACASGAQAQYPDLQKNIFPNNIDGAYQPSIFNSMTEVDSLFWGLHRDFDKKFLGMGGSQCYQRAHVWAYEMSQYRNIKSMKVYILYTRKFKEAFKSIESNKTFLNTEFKWWFHVAPFVKMNDSTEVVLDAEFFKKPVTLREWQARFIDRYLVERWDGKVNNRVPGCKEVGPEFITNGPDNPNTPHYNENWITEDWEHYCYFVKVPMYYSQPVHVFNAHRNKQPQTFFVPGDVSYAMKGKGDVPNWDEDDRRR